LRPQLLRRLLPQEDAAADEEALAEEDAIKHDREVEDEEREGGEMENELPDVN
jgi:hypothetical protein